LIVQFKISNDVWTRLISWYTFTHFVGYPIKCVLHSCTSGRGGRTPLHARIRWRLEFGKLLNFAEFPAKTNRPLSRPAGSASRDVVGDVRRPTHHTQTALHEAGVVRRQNAQPFLLDEIAHFRLFNGRILDDLNWFGRCIA
jgi:hypothetical protein